MKKLFDSLSSVRSKMTYLASPLSYLFLTYWATVTTASARIALWDLFWHSGRSKVAGWQFWSPTELTVELFAVEYKTPLLSPYAAAVAASSIEHVFGVLILLGLFTRFSAVILLGMTLVIAVFIYPANWGQHLFWIACLLVLLKYGGGGLSLDRAFFHSTIASFKARIPLYSA